MISKKESYIDDKLDQSNFDEEIDFKQVYSFYSRNKKPLAIYGLVGILVGGIIAFSSKKVWNGEFQIVLRLDNQSPTLQQAPLNLSFGLGNKSDPLETEVGILKSPSVLMDIFKFVKADRTSKIKGFADKFKTQNLKFNDWKEKNLKIELQKNTSILNLSYKDNDKEIILPVLNKISKAYQKYSGKQRERDLELNSKYFAEQVSLYKEKSKNSLREVQEFASKYDLSVLSSKGEGQGEGDNIIDPYSINIEIIRINAANKIRLLDAQLEQLNNLDPNSDKVNFISIEIPELKDLYTDLKKIDTNIAKLRVTYKDSDKTIQDQLKNREILKKFIYRQAKGFLEAQKEAAEAEYKSTNRPKGVLVEFRQLLSTAAKDEATLDKLEIQYRKVMLEKARIKDPWDLITTPTLYPDPIAPLKKRIVALGLLGGIVVGTVSILIRDIKKNTLFTSKEIERITGLSKIDEFDISESNNWQESLELFLKSSFIKELDNLAFLQVGGVDNKSSSDISNLVSKSLGAKKYLNNKNIIELEKFTNVVLIVFLGSIKKEELLNLNKNLNFMQKEIIGYISIN